MELVICRLCGNVVWMQHLWWQDYNNYTNYLIIYNFCKYCALNCLGVYLWLRVYNYLVNFTKLLMPFMLYAMHTQVCTLIAKLVSLFWPVFLFLLFQGCNCSLWNFSSSFICRRGKPFLCHTPFFPFKIDHNIY